MLSEVEVLALNLCSSISSNNLKNLVESGASLPEITNAEPEDLIMLGLSKKAILGVKNINSFLENAELEFAKAKELNVKIINYWNENYPQVLKEIYSPPMVLYVLGDTNFNEICIGIIGTRNNSYYGKLATERYAEYFAYNNLTVVSGMARGIDTIAHKTTLESNGRTIAVIASGLDEISTDYNLKLAKEISVQGAVISEYPFGTKALPAYFPQRNRIISGLCKAIVIIESDSRGGSMITAQFALDQNRDLFALPGNITSQKSKGTNELIKKGEAKLSIVPEDILEELNLLTKAETRINTNIRDTTSLSFFEKQVYDLLDEEPKHIDLILENLNMTPSELMVNLLSLEFKGFVRQLAGKMFLLNTRMKPK